MSTELAEVQRQAMPAEIAERVLVGGDLSKLNSNERLAFYRARCDAAGLDMRGRPFEFLQLQGKLVLYAKKECAEQLNGLHGLSHEILSTESVSGLYEVRVKVTSRSGRTSEDIGTVVVDGLRGADLANARMKAVTKAKRRATLSFCGLGDVIDESELDTMRRTDHLASANNNQTGHGSGAYAAPSEVMAYVEWVKCVVNEVNSKWLDRWTSKHGEIHPGVKDLLNTFQLSGHLLKWARQQGLVNSPEESRAGSRDKYAAVAWGRFPDEFEGEAKAYARLKWSEESARIKAMQPVGEVPADECEVDDQLEGVTDADSDVWPEGKE